MRPPHTTLPISFGSIHSHVRFGSLADMCAAKANVRFTSNSDRESRHPQTVMSALPPKADMCSANLNVRYGPKADIGPTSVEYGNARQDNPDFGELARL